MTIDFAQYATLVWVVGFAAVVGIAAGISTLFKNWAVIKAARDPARNPPLPEAFAKEYATKAELISMREELRTTCARNHEHVDKIHNDIFNLIRCTQREILVKFDGLVTAISEWQRGTERQLGKIEGKMGGK